MKIVLECGPCDGDWAYALDIVDYIADLGDANVAMKVQFYTADSITTKDAPRYDRTDSRRVSQHDLFRTQLTYDQWHGVAERARKRNVTFFPTVFSSEAITQAHAMGINTLKIASGDITYIDLIEEAAFGTETLIISTGAARQHEILRAVSYARNNGVMDVTVLACHLAYPSHLHEANLGRIRALQELRHHPAEGGFAVGYSDHTPGIETAPLLVALGATMWEKHFSMRSTEETDGDHAFAIRPTQLAQARLAITETAAMMAGTLEPTLSEMAARAYARRSWATTAPVAAGEGFSAENTAYLRPGTGISITTSKTLMRMGAVASRHVPALTSITPDLIAAPEHFAQ